MKSVCNSVAVFLGLGIPIAAQSVEYPTTEAGAKFRSVEGYLGSMTKSVIAKNIHSRMMNQTSIRSVGSTADRVRAWHEIALDAVAMDHTPDPETGMVSFTQGGPTRTSRALAMTQLAVYDALASFYESERGYAYQRSNNSSQTAKDAAIATAAKTVLKHLFPDQEARIHLLFESDLQQIDNSPNQSEITRGRSIGYEAAMAINRKRENDGSLHMEPHFGEGGLVADGNSTFRGTRVNGGSRNRFEWVPDPNTPPNSGDFNLSLGARWGGVTPFILDRGDVFRIPPPPAPETEKYKAAYRRVSHIGGSPDNTGIQSFSSPHTRFVGNFWGYDAVPLLGTPPRAYNQIFSQVYLAAKPQVSAVNYAQALACLNVALADSAIAAWDSKYYYNYWRPVIGIRSDDGVAETTRDVRWNPVGVSVVNVDLPGAFIRPSPPFPAYPSGHATFGAATFELLRQMFGDHVAFTFVSDEYNGEGVDPFDSSVPRPLVPRRFSSFTAAQEENGISRVYNGVHWNYDNIEGQKLGVKVGNEVLSRLASHTSANLVSNSGFEYGLDDWGDWRDNSYSLEKNARSGSRSMAIGATEGGSWQRIHDISPGDTLTASTWAYRTNLNTPATFGIFFDDANGNQLASATAPIPGSVYGNVNITRTAPANTHSVRVWFWKGSNKNWLIVDDVSVVKQ